MKIDAHQLNDQEQVILIIDDSPDVHRLLSARLRKDELIVRSAMSGTAGLEIARADPPTAVLLDLDMPEMDGFEVLRLLKDDAATMHIPVIVLSGLQSPQDKVTAFDLGAVDYICKPFDLTELRVRVRSVVRMSNLVQMLAQRAQVDGLTGLYNRAHFDARWSEVIAGCVRHGRSLALAILDCDHFKSINDTYGHPAGDTVLQNIGRILLRECRGEDVPCRYGGEEFALIMPDTTHDDALVVCERIRQVISDVTWPRHPERAVTVSIGLVGSNNAHDADAQRWIEHADKNMYAAKQSGRNRTVSTRVGEGTGPALAKAG